MCILPRCHGGRDSGDLLGIDRGQHAVRVAATDRTESERPGFQKYGGRKVTVQGEDALPVDAVIRKASGIVGLINRLVPRNF